MGRNTNQSRANGPHDPLSVGPHFASGKTSIGRTRLPSGLVAITDAQILRAAIAELHDYANNNRVPNRPRRGIVYREVEQWEFDALQNKLFTFYGEKRLDELSLFRFTVGHHHIIDDSTVSHACNRHAITEGAQPHLLLTLADFQLIPEVVNPRYIGSFSVTKDKPRIVYERELNGQTLVVVEEVRLRAGFAAKTAYKKR
jgi:hypothetical protein